LQNPSQKSNEKWQIKRDLKKQTENKNKNKIKIKLKLKLKKIKIKIKKAVKYSLKEEIIE